MKKICCLAVTVVVILLSVMTGRSNEGSPSFYLGTDRSFGSGDRPYVNLEGPGNREYNFRVYRISNPDDFFVKSVKGRLVKQGNDDAYGNAVTLFKNSFDYFKSDFRKIARSEFNSNTRSQAKKAAGVDLDAPSESRDLALPAILSGHKLVTSFSIPKGKEAWEYRRVPVPIDGNGVYLIEGVSGRSVSHTVIVKSNLTFVTKLSDSDTLIYIARRDSGTPEDKAEVKIYGAGSDKPAAKGLATGGIFSYKGKTSAKSLIVVKKGSEYAVSDPDFYAKSFYGEGGVRAFIYTDRPVYRPGDQVFFKGIVRNFSDDDYRLSSGGGTVDVSTEKGDVIANDIKVSVSQDNGTFEGSFTLPNNPDQYLGTYNVVLSFSGKSYATEFGVDAYKKPPYLVKVSTPKRTYIGKQKITASVSARFYYGSPVSDGSIRYRVFRKKKYDYSPVGSLPFFAEAAEYLGLGGNAASDLVADGSGKLTGQGTYDISFTPEKVDDDYTYSVIADVSTSDATISGSTAVSVNRSAFFIRTIKEMSVFAPGDTVKVEAKLIPFDQTLENSEKKSLIEKRSVKATLYTRTFYGISREGKRDKVDSNDALTDADGSAKLSFKLPKKGHYIIVLTAKDPSGAETVTETPLWASGKSDSIEVPFKNVTLKSSKDLYSVGEEAEILMMSPSADGTLFVTLEGNRILGSETVKLKGNTYRYKVRITQAMAPNFTVSATQFAHGEIYKSEIKIVAPPREKFLTVKIDPGKKEYKPGETAQIAIDTLNDKNKGVSAEVSVAVVDEAIFQIREDANPNIATYFYHPRTNNVSTVFSSAYRFFGYAEDRRLKLALDAKRNPALAALKEDDSKSRERFKDTTYWSAKVKTDANGHAVVKVPLAENITTWRVTAIAVTSDTKVGQGKAQFLSRKKLMVMAGVPRFMIRNDAQSVVANVTNLTDKKMNVAVTASADGGAIEGAPSQNISVDAGKSMPVYFTVRPSNDENTSSTAVEFKVKGGELSDGVKMRVPLMYFGRKSTLPEAIVLKTGNANGKATFSLPSKFIAPSCEIRLSPGSGDALRESLKYLADYPYGCIEQTMSRFMPLLAAKQSGYISQKLKNELPKMTAEGLRLIASHQKEDGGFGWYGEKDSDPLMTAYVYRGLVLSKKLSVNVESYLVSRARYYLFRSIDKNNFDAFSKAYVIFSLSEGEKIQKSMLDKLVGAAQKDKPYTKVLTALACINSKDPRGAALYAQARSEYMKITDPEKSAGIDTSWPDDQVETGAALLTAAVRLGEDPADIEALAAKLVSMRRDIAWKNSRDTAFAVLALSEKLAKFRENAEPSNISVSVNGKTAQSVRVSAKEVDAGSTVINVPASDIRAGNNTVTVNKSGGNAVYATVMVRFTDRSDSFKPLANGFNVSRKYYKVDAEKSDSGVKLSVNESAAYSAGDLVMVSVDVKSAEGVGDYLMIEDPVPAGFSVVKNDGDYYSDKYPRLYGEKQAYDDRAVFFVKGPVRETTIRYFIRAELPGKYRILPASASQMYYPDKNGSSADAQISVSK